MGLLDRLIYSVLGAVFGGLVGAGVFWLLGVYSRTLGPTGYVRDAGTVIAASGLVFAVIGFIFGASAGTAVGRIVSTLFEFERILDWPWVWFLLIVFGFGVFWFAFRA